MASKLRSDEIKARKIAHLSSKNISGSGGPKKMVELEESGGI